MKVDKNLVDRVARIARINLSEKEKQKFAGDLMDVLKAFSIINKVDTSNMSMSLQPITLLAKYNEDILTKCLTQKDALANTKHKEKGYFKGPRLK